jgi:hypothetical protein
MNSTDGVKREIRRLRDRLVERDFRSSAPLLDEDGLPNWSGGESLTTEGYAKALAADVPDDDLTEAELATRERLSPYASVFSRLEETEKAGGEDVTT